jgi:hypothetical protein
VALNVPRDPGVALHNQLEETERGLVYDLSTLIDRRPGPQARRPDDDQRGADVDRRLRAVRERFVIASVHCERHVVGCEGWRPRQRTARSSPMRQPAHSAPWLPVRPGARRPRGRRAARARCVARTSRRTTIRAAAARDLVRGPDSGLEISRRRPPADATSSPRSVVDREPAERDAPARDGPGRPRHECGSRLDH